MRAGLAIAVAAGIVLGAAPGAEAALVTRCVGSPSGCAGTVYPGDAAGLQQALDDSALHIDPDLVRIGAGTYTATAAGGFNYSSGELDIQGDGPFTTIIKPSGAPSARAMTISAGGNANSTMSDFGIQLAGANGQTGIQLGSGVASNLRVTGPDTPGSSNLGVDLVGHANLENTTVDLPGEHGGVFSEGAGNDISDCTVRADTAIVSSVNLGLTRCLITADFEGVSIGGATANLDNNVIHLGGTAVRGLTAFMGAVVNASNLTVIGDPGAGHGAEADNTTGGSTTINLDSTIFSGFSADLYTSQTSGSAVINATYSRVAVADNSAGGSINQGAGVVSSDPVFTGPGDYHQRFDSPLIDAGKPGTPAATADLGGATRVVDGDGDSDAVVDMGAFEYQRRAPTAGIIGPDSGQPGELLTFTSRSSDPDPGDTLANAWTFAGQPDSGAVVVRSFAAPGKYPVSLTVTDPSGQKSTATSEVAITDSLLPILRGVGATNRTFRVNPKGAVLARKAKKGTTFRFSVSEASTMTFLIERRTKGRKVGSKCRRATRKLRKRKACVRYVKVKSFSRAAKAGLNRVAFSGRYRLRGKTRRLTPARYRLTLRAKDLAGNSSAPSRIAFRVVR
jgi:hypothetical protein